MAKKSRKKMSKGELKFYKITSILLIIVSTVFICLLFYMNVLPLKYTLTILGILTFFDGCSLLILNYKLVKKKIKKVVSVICIIVIILMSIVSILIARTLGVLIGNGDSKYKLENYSVIVLKTSEYEKLEDIKNKTVGYYDNGVNSNEIENRLKKEIKINFKSYKSSDTQVQDLLNSKVDAIVLEDSIKSIMEEEIENFSNSIKVIYTFSIKKEVESTLKDVDVTKDCFAIYISGIDTYGKISSVSRSDVNIVAIINPKNKQVLLISIPRDYYVQLHGTTGYKDKLTHAGIYGIDMSIQTIEDLLDIYINYYVKVNFTSVIDIVDALDGVSVYSDYTFISYSGYSFKKGYNEVNGEQALDFARTRKAFTDGDRQRGKNQQALIEALIRKASSKAIITKYSSLLSAVDGKYQTNMSVKKITSLIKKQLNDMTPWNITSYSLTGSDSTNYTYTYNQLLYVMEPNQSSIDEARELIDKVLKGEKLESTYGGSSDNANKVTKAPTPVKPEEVPTTPNVDDNSDTENSDSKEDDNIDDNIDDEINDFIHDFIGEENPDGELNDDIGEIEENPADNPSENPDIDDPLDPIIPQDEESAVESLSYA